jgi:hypothetical protein
VYICCGVPRHTASVKQLDYWISKLDGDLLGLKRLVEWLVCGGFVDNNCNRSKQIDIAYICILGDLFTRAVDWQRYRGNVVLVGLELAVLFNPKASTTARS